MHFTTLLAVAAAAATSHVASAKIVCQKTNYAQDSTIITHENESDGPYIGETANHTFVTLGDDSGSDWAFIYAFSCTSDYMNITTATQKQIPQANYGLMLILGPDDGPDVQPGPTKRCLAVEFDKGTTESGKLVSQLCSFKDDASQLTQFWSFWQTYPPYRTYQKFVGSQYYGEPANPYPYGPSYNFKYSKENGAAITLRREEVFRTTVSLTEVG